MHQGYRDLIARNPEWTPLHHRLASAAFVADDRKLARELFAKPELQWFPEAGNAAWSAQQWAAVKEWATAEVEDFMLTGRWPQILLRSDLAFRERSPANGLNAFLVKTEQGIAAVSILPNRVQSPKQEMLHSALQQWTLRDPATGAAMPMTIDTNVRQLAGYSRMLVAPLTGPAPSAFALKMRTAELRRRKFVLVCQPDPAGGCRQRALALERANGAWVADGDDVNVDFASAVGAPVLDADGYAIGIVTGGSGPTVKFELIFHPVKNAMTSR